MRTADYFLQLEGIWSPGQVLIVHIDLYVPALCITIMTPNMLLLSSPYDCVLLVDYYNL